MGELLGAFGRAFAASAALALPAAFLWGVLSVVLSPCHLSSIPLVVAYMSGGEELPERRRALALATSFASGVLGSIAFVGLATAAAGRIAGDVGRAGSYALVAVFLAFGLNLLGILPLPSFSAGRSASGRRGAAGAFVLGLAFGAALGPCTFAFMAPLLALAFRTGARSAVYGALLVALYGLGHAMAIAAAGTSAQSVQRWLAWRAGARAATLLRGVAGVAVIAGGLWFLYTAP
ncbi:cytochrome c biogenesis CcdA family protein [Anaeromyxobacter terrae]|uniref:cytochrome c biogenesis CcdA family protein n=1 Tax=Anaeromyxobacter terrae TaxID=2925406 RepID=UPI001F5720C6|nr:cytochrome c biogenesis protein CcdA [Anaeromyxobacter sp. SG22]